MTETVSIAGVTLTGVHAPGICRGRLCTVHNPIPDDHPHASWALRWRNDRAIFERICPHGIGHPAIEQLEYWAEIGSEYLAVHGCCGCCHIEEAS